MCEVWRGGMCVCAGEVHRNYVWVRIMKRMRVQVRIEGINGNGAGKIQRRYHLDYSCTSGI